MSLSPNVFTIPAGENFLSRLAEAISTGRLPGRDGHASDAIDPLALSGYTILMPTRRACRALQDEFLRQTGGTALLLPQIRPIAETEEDAQLLSSTLAFSGSVSGGDADPLEIPSAISELERRLVLTQFILTWLKSDIPEGETRDILPLPMSPAQAANLARELAGLMDEIDLEQADLSLLAEDMPPEFAAHWQRTLGFLDVATKAFPTYLDASGRTTPNARQNLLLQSEIERLEKNPPDRPIIAAGLASSDPQTAAFMKAIAGLPQGAVILPGLDLALDDESWSHLGVEHPEHPQIGLAEILHRLDVARSDVRPLLEATSALQRNRLLSEAMRPAATTAAWHRYAEKTDTADVDAALSGIEYLEAQSAQDEAEAISLILRGAAEDESTTAALVTPDRTLARRVAVRLEAWGIRIDDSAGRPLMKTVPGTFLDLILECFETEFAPTTVVALLKHPLTRLGLSPGDARRGAVALELLAFRQIYLGKGFVAIRPSLERGSISAIGDTHRVHPAVKALSSDDRDMATLVLDRLEVAVAPLRDLEMAERVVALRDLVRAHVQVAEAIAVNDEGESGNLWGGEAGEAASYFFSTILEDTGPQPELVPADYPSFFRALVSGEVVRPRLPVHPRLSIWGPLEARLQQADIMILGGLNDGKWPNLADPDPWINRPMRTQIGLPPPERKIGLSAHDFTQLAAAPRVYLTRAAKVDGVPTVPSRWLMRLEAVLKGLGRADDIRPNVSDGAAWLQWAESRDEIKERKPVKAPRPTPPVDMRPRQMSVTRIESWLGNPYSVFARSILKLTPLDALEAAPDMATRGRIIHEALHRFTVRHPITMPQDAAKVVMGCADEILNEYVAHPRVAAFWRPRIRRFAEWFAATEPRRRGDVSRIVTEVGGQCRIALPDGDFILTARADRIDVAEDGRVLIYDYKSGTAPSESHVVNGVSPQLPLEAAIVHAGGFETIDATTVSGLTYISASGGEPPGEERLIKKVPADDLAKNALSELTRLVADYDRPETDYRAVRRAAFANAYRYDDYAHLARVQEWSLGDGDDG